MSRVQKTELKIQLLVREYKAKYGLSRYTAAICKALSECGLGFELITPHHPLLITSSQKILSRLGYDLERFFSTYPISAPVNSNSLKHLTAQQMAALYYFKPNVNPAVITVHDIVPHLVRGDRNQNTFRHPFDYLFDSLAMRGLQKADLLIAISDYTKKTLVESIGIPQEKIKVILYGVDHSVFRPVNVSDGFRNRYGLADDHQYIVYVGAESPRKNLPRLVRSFAKLKDSYPRIKLIKVGTPEYMKQYHQLQILIEQLDLKKDVLFINHPPQDDLVAFYNLADVFVFPSLYEGFGMPPLEALACGAPVVCSDAASLPEVVGDAAILVDPHDVEGLAAAMRRVLADADLRHSLQEKGLQRAAQYSWERTARETLEVYETVSGGLN